MNKFCKIVMLIVASAIFALTASAETITSMLDKIHAKNVQELIIIPTPSKVQDAYERVLSVVPGPHDGIYLHTSNEQSFAETLTNRNISRIYVSPTIVVLSEPELIFVLAHELAHVKLDHWQRLRTFYETKLPGEIELGKTKYPLNFHIELSALSYGREFEADAFAYDVIKKLGYKLVDIMPLFLRLISIQDGLSHPGTQTRFERLQELGDG